MVASRPPPQPPAPSGSGLALKASALRSRQTLGWSGARRGLEPLGLGALTILAASLPPLVAYVGKLIVDAVVARDSDRAVRMVLFELAVVAAMALLERSLGLVGSWSARAWASTSTWPS
jgi:hypothetical protein